MSEYGTDDEDIQDRLNRLSGEDGKYASLRAPKPEPIEDPPLDWPPPGVRREDVLAYWYTPVPLDRVRTMLSDIDDAYPGERIALITHERGIVVIRISDPHSTHGQLMHWNHDS